MMPEPNIFDVADQFKRQMLRRERQAASEMVRAYGESWKRIRARLDDLGGQIEQARQLEQTVSPAWLFQYDRLLALQRQVEAEIGDFARYAEARIITEQAEAVLAAQEYAERSALAGLGKLPPGVTLTWTRLPGDAVADLIGFLQDGSPLRELLDELGPEASQAVRDSLISGLIMGQNPRAIARVIRRELGDNLARALRIARTEILRSFREASLRAYRANDDVVKGWIWHSALGTRTCAACWAMHGTFHTLDERLDDHPNGRCAPVPVTKTWKELGFEGVSETSIEVESGESLFGQLSEEQQRQILGVAAYKAYKAGLVQLSDFVEQESDPRWGTMRHVRSLRKILEEKGLQQQGD